MVLYQALGSHLSISKAQIHASVLAWSQSPVCMILPFDQCMYLPGSIYT